MAEPSWHRLKNDQPDHGTLCVVVVEFRNGEQEQLARFDATRGCFCENPDVPQRKRKVRTKMWRKASKADEKKFETADGNVIAKANADPNEKGDDDE